MNLLVVTLGILAIGAVNWWFFLAGKRSVAASSAAGFQEATIVILGGYDPAEVRLREGLPTRLHFDRQEDSSCSEEIVIPDLSLRQFLPPFQKSVVQLPALPAGRYQISCGMGMLHGEFVVEPGQEVRDEHHT